jgi:multiple sugar transport system substrate-binding protein
MISSGKYRQYLQFHKFAKFWILLPLLLSFLLILAGCNGDILSIDRGNITPTPTSLTAPLAEEEISDQTVQTTAEPAASPDSPKDLVLWVPPQFGPTGNSAAWELLVARLEEFNSIYPESEINVRVKAPDGIGGMLDSLSSAGAAAPLSLPSLALLSRTDLEVAALKGLIFPLDDITAADSEEDWYTYAKQLSRIDESTFGLPFAGDALLFMYRPANTSDIPDTWQSVIALNQPVLFPASDPQALVTMTLYQSVGGLVQDQDGHPTIQAEPLQQVLESYAEGSHSGVFPSWITQYQDDDQTWQAYQEERVDYLITWSSQFLTKGPVSSSAGQLPSMTDVPYTSADGWLWVLSDPYPERQSFSMQLAEYLVESEFLSSWNAEAGYLPPRPSALATWTSNSYQIMLDELSQAARINPRFEISAALGSILKDATLQVIEQNNDPAQSAAAAAERLLPTD